MLHEPDLSQVELSFQTFLRLWLSFVWHRDCVSVTPVPDMEWDGPFLTHPSVPHRDLIISWFRLIIMAQVPHLVFIIKLTFLQFGFNYSEIIPLMN